VAAIMAGVRDGQGTQGIAFDAKVIPLQNWSYDLRSERLFPFSKKDEHVAAAILKAITYPDVDIIVLENQIWGGPSEQNGHVRAAIRLATEAGITVVSAAGNGGRTITKRFGGEAVDSIIVGAIDKNGTVDESTRGPGVDVAAFGSEVHTLYPRGRKRYQSFSGTSAAAPQVAATVALMLEVNPTLSPAQVREILVATRRTTPQNQAVGGLLDVYAAVALARATPLDEEGARTRRARREQLAELLASEGAPSAPSA
jgi:subtilisin family serine protease